MFQSPLSLLLDIYSEVGILDHGVVLFLIFLRYAILFFTVAVPLYIPTNSVHGFQFLRSLSNTCCFLYTCSIHPNVCEVV